MAIRQFTAIDLFCGAGGLTQGFKAAGYRVVYALDQDKECIDTYRLNHPEVEADQLSIGSTTPAELADRIGKSIDVIVGGPSCQGFSTANRKKADEDERNQLWSYMLALTRTLDPRAFVLENVPGLMYWKEGHHGHEILKGFEDAGYTVHFDILLAANYGVPQLRRRIFMVGIKGSKFVFPKPTHMGGFRRDAAEKWERLRKKYRLHRHISCWEAIGDLPALGDGRGAPVAIYANRTILSPYAELMRGQAKAVNDHEVFALPADHAELVKWVPQGGTWRDIPGHLLPDRFYGIRRTDSSNLLGRMDPDRPAYTITKSFSNVTAGCFVHPWEDRVLSVREGARLQSFRDDYAFSGTLTGRYRMVGNAVPPILGEVLGRRLAKQLEGEIEEKKRQRAIVKPASVPVPPPTDEATGRRMRRQPRRDTRPEVLLRQALHKRGLRYRTATKPVQGLRREVDIVFPTAKVAVFVDGCFWHGCPIHSRPTKSHTVWWADKIKANQARDVDTISQLESLGWKVVRVWEHETPEAAALLVEAALGRTYEEPEPEIRPELGVLEA